jgi:hypothetical protein
VARLHLSVVSVDVVNRARRCGRACRGGRRLTAGPTPGQSRAVAGLCSLWLARPRTRLRGGRRSPPPASRCGRRGSKTSQR